MSSLLERIGAHRHLCRAPVTTIPWGLISAKAGGPIFYSTELIGFVSISMSTYGMKTFTDVCRDNWNRKMQSAWLETLQMGAVATAPGSTAADPQRGLSDGGRYLQ
jgi:hypothetical protein